MKGFIHSIETFGTVDGPGVRYVVFMQGCPLRCKFCHNPDTWKTCCGEEKSAQEIFDDILKYTNYIQGVTITGGEPLLQMEFVEKLFSLCKQVGLETCLDTSGMVNLSSIKARKMLENLLSVTDLVILDIKDIDDENHKWLTGASVEPVLNFARFVDEKGKKIWLRKVLVPTVNDKEESLFRWREFKETLKNVEKVELLPYHTLGIEKYKKLGIDYPLEGISEPTQEQIKKAKEILNI